MRMLVRAGWLVPAALLASLAGIAAAGPAAAQVDDEQSDTLVVLTGRVVVRGDETVDNVIIVDGPAIVNGTVRNGLVALNGDVLVRGVVEDEVFAPGGRVTIAGSGQVQGDIVSRHRPDVRGGGSFDGDWDRWDPRAWSRASAIFARVAVWVVFTVSTLLLGLILGVLLPRAPEPVHQAARERIGPVIGWGLLLAIGLPVVAVVAMATVVALPLGLGLLLALGLVYGIGYTAAAWILGRLVLSRGRPVLSFLAGWGILRLVALVPVLGGLSWLAAVVVGLGAIAVAGYRARGRAGAVAAEVPPAPRPAGTPP